jgi:hypothetical protein
VRDEGLAGKLPLVFLDEFDVEFNGPLGWLRFLLAPMQDGEFTEDGVTHPVGRAIFTFAGGTRASFRKFSEPLLFEEKHPDRISFVAAKGPDFVSRLRGHVDILGPDPSSPDDRMYPIRRAILLRSLILKHAPQLFREEANVPPTEQPLRIDPGVLRALLQTRAYRHGARSMEAVLLMSRLTGRQEFERAALPPQGQLEMHVDAKAFLTQVDAERLSDKMRDQLAPLLHERYRQRQLWRARRKPDPALANDPSMRPWETLPEHMKESNRLQADDIPRKLRLIDCYMAPEDPGRAVFDIRPFWRKLAREEHDRWLAERLQRHWREGRRNALDRTTPFLRPWQDLDILTRGNDLNAVASIPFVLGCIGYRIYRLDQP